MPEQIDIEINTKVNSDELEDINSLLKELQDKGIDINVNIESNADEALDEINTIDNTSIDTKQVEFDSNSQDILDDIDTINIANFDDLVTSFKSSTDEMANDAQAASESITSNFEEAAQAPESLIEALSNV